MPLKNMCFFLTLFLVLSLSNAAPNVPPGTICASTKDPSYCKTVLGNHSGNIYHYGRISVKKSLSQSQKLLNTLNKYLQNSSSFSQSTIGALQDCKFLAKQNIEYLTNTQGTVDESNDVLQSSQAEDAVTLLSAILTNQQTCLDGLQTSASNEKVKSDLSSTVNEDTKLLSVSLALFLKGWVPDKKITTSFQSGGNLGFSNGRLPLNIPKQVNDMFNSARGGNGRKLLESSSSSVKVKGMVVVNKDGSGNFTTINAAIAAAPNNSASSGGYFLILIKKGVYQEYVSIDQTKKYLMLVGDGINQTIITGNHNVVDGSTTFNSATFAVVAQGFVAVNITFRNTAGPSKQQAVAVRNGADLSTFYSCSFEGYQDTLYTHSMRQFYRECDIYGTIDFIFGNAAVLLQNCNIFPRLPSSGQFNTITAQGRTDPNQNTGTCIQNATIKAASDLAPKVGTVKTYLGRPWKQYSRTVFMQSFMDSLIDPSGWHEWNGTFGLSTLYYAEFNNTGPGSSTANRITWSGYHVIGAKDATNFTVTNFLQGDSWLPQTGVPFLSGLN